MVLQLLKEATIIFISKSKVQNHTVQNATNINFRTEQKLKTEKNIFSGLNL